MQELLTEGDPATLETYLHTLQAGAGLDLILVCNSDHRPVAQTDELVADALCAAGAASDFHVVAAEPVARAWLFAAHPVAETGFDVVVSVALDNVFATQMRDQSGLEHTLLVHGKPAATSLAGSVAAHSAMRSIVAQDEARFTFNLDGSPYYAVRLGLSDKTPAGPQELQAEVMLVVSEIFATQRRLVWMLAGGILIVAVVGSGTGVFLARRIGQPLARLTQAAALSQGDLSSPVAVQARVREVALVAQALESARADLEQTLDQLRREKSLDGSPIGCHRRGDRNPGRSRSHHLFQPWG